MYDNQTKNEKKLTSKSVFKEKKKNIAKSIDPHNVEYIYRSNVEEGTYIKFGVTVKTPFSAPKAVVELKCQSCNSSAKYRIPRSMIPYCSAICYKKIKS